MALVLADRVQETCTSPGTGAITLLGATSGYQTFGSAIGNGNNCYYCIADQNGNNWEVGIGTYASAGNTLTRTTPISGSSATPVNFSAGTQNVFVTYPAEKSVNLDANGKISADSNYYLDFASDAPATAAGRMWFDDSTGSWNMGMTGGNVTQQVGQEQYYYIKASATITNGQVVMFTGTVGASGVLTGAPASGLTAETASYVMGIATEDIATNDFGYVTSFGVVRNINTTAFSDGQILYLDTAVAGGLTATTPLAPAPKVQVCVCVLSAANGSLFVRPTFGGVLGQYEGDVGVSSPLNGQLLIRDQTSGKWVNSNLTAGTGIGVSNAAGSITISNSGVTSITGTANQVTASAATGGVTLSLPATINVDTSGNAATATSAGKWTTARTLSFTGDATGSNSVDGSANVATALTLANTTVTAGSYTNTALTVDSKGRITAASSGPDPVTSVGATAPIQSSGGLTPTISITQASSTTNGFLSSTDWNTFNNKGSGTVTSVTGTSPVSSSGGATPAISLESGYGDTQNPYASKTANYFLAAPNGASGAPTFRAIVASDIPTLNQNTTGQAGSVAFALTAGTGISFSSGTTYNGSAAITINSTGSFTYPGAGIVVSTGSAWGTSLTAPSGAIVGTTDTQTLTNKRLTPRVVTTTSTATPSIDTDATDMYGLTALAVNITSVTVTGTPTNGQKLWIYIVGTAARTIAWGSSFESSTVVLPTTTVSTNRLDVGFVWNDVTLKWRCIAVA